MCDLGSHVRETGSSPKPLRRSQNQVRQALYLTLTDPLQYNETES